MSNTRTTRVSKGFVLQLGLMALCAASLASLSHVSLATALPSDPFTPQLSVCTSLVPCTAQVFDFSSGEGYVPTTFAGNLAAGAHPDLTVRMQKTINHCPDFDFECDLEDLYMEQDLKRMTTHLPPGLVPDANAAPYCNAFQDWVPVGANTELLEWQCQNPESMVGWVDIVVAGCNRDEVESHCQITTPVPPGSLFHYAGVVYNEQPGPDEQGHLVVFWPGDPGQPDFYNNIIKTDVSITVRDSDTGVDAIADNIPDYTEITSRYLGGEPQTSHSGAQISDLVMTLYGSKGEDTGHPLLTNPTFCDPQTVDVEFQGYANNSVDFPPLPGGNVSAPGSGEGKLVTDSAPYQVTGCDSVPYDPNLTIDLDNTGPEGVPAISSTVTQGPGEATTDNVKVKFPKSFKINVANTAEHCSDADLQAKTCPESSKVGTVTAESPLLPEQGPMAGPLTGNVYLAGLTADSVKLSAFLTGFVDLRIDAEGKVEDDLTLTTTFADLPAVPISKFDLNLEGGTAKGLLKNPKVCGPETITADFTSHSGKVKTNTVPVDIEGCTDPALDVELSNRHKGELTDLDLSINSPGTAIKAIELRMARYLKWGRRKRLSPRVAKRIKRLKSAGTVAFATASGEQKVRFKAKRTKRGNLSFTPLFRKTKAGQVIAAQVPGFSASLFRTARRQPALIKKKTKGSRKGKSKGKRRRGRRQADLTLAGLPGDDLTTVELDLRGKDPRRKFFIRNPSGCKKPLNFVAIVTTANGRKLALKDQVKLRGKGCKNEKS